MNTGTCSNKVISGLRESACSQHQCIILSCISFKIIDHHLESRHTDPVLCEPPGGTGLAKTHEVLPFCELNDLVLIISKIERSIPGKVFPFDRGTTYCNFYSFVFHFADIQYSSI